jgi:hypothetical protein
MIETISFEPLRTGLSAAAARTGGLDLACLQGDGSARAGDDGRRRVLTCPPFPRRATPQVCLAAWHGVLHRLRHDDRPVTTCQVGRWAQACWILATRADRETTLGQLLADVDEQWLPPHGDWLDLGDAEHAGLQDLLRQHAVRLEPGPEDVVPELSLAHVGDRWLVSCAASRYSEGYQRFLLSLWAQFIATLLQDPQALLSEQGGRDMEAAA